MQTRSSFSFGVLYIATIARFVNLGVPTPRIIELNGSTIRVALQTLLQRLITKTQFSRSIFVILYLTHPAGRAHIGKPILFRPEFYEKQAAYNCVEAHIWTNGETWPKCGECKRASEMQGKSIRIGAHKCHKCREHCAKPDRGDDRLPEDLR